MNDQFGFKVKNLDENKEDRVVKGYANHTNKKMLCLQKFKHIHNYIHPFYYCASFS